MIDDRTPAEKRAALYNRGRQWLPIILSACALAVSLVSAYFTTFVVKDDIRVVVGHAPRFLLKKNGDISVSGWSSLTFINSGNRQALIFELTALITKLKSFIDPDQNCRTEKSTQIKFTGEPFIMKPGDIVSKKPDMVLLTDKNGNVVIPKPFFSDFFL
jgi:hypothetical protein